jgi:hypothetical protein
MNSSASGSQRTGQPRCVQLTANAMNSVLVHPAQPSGSFGGHAGPRQRRSVEKRYVHGFPDFELTNLADRAPDIRRFPKKWRDQKADHREAENRRTNRA